MFLRSRSARRAPWTATRGPLSPPMASTEIRIVSLIFRALPALPGVLHHTQTPAPYNPGGLAGSYLSIGRVLEGFEAGKGRFFTAVGLRQHVVETGPGRPGIGVDGERQ